MQLQPAHYWCVPVVGRSAGIRVSCLLVLTFVRVDRLQVEEVSDDVILVGDAVAPQHVSGLPGHFQGLPTVVPLHNGDHLWTRSAQENTTVLEMEVTSDLCLLLCSNNNKNKIWCQSVSFQTGEKVS